MESKKPRDRDTRSVWIISPLLWSLLRQHETLGPAEQKIAVFLWAGLIEAGGSPLELAIRDIAAGTELCWKTVQKYRLTLIKNGAIRLVSRGRERSRFALPAGVTVHEVAEVPASKVEVTTPKNPEEEISELMAEMTGGRADREFMREAEERAGGQAELIQFLRALKQNGVGRKRTRHSLLVVIRQLNYSRGLSRTVTSYGEFA